jgi:hypothetical protein
MFGVMPGLALPFDQFVKRKAQGHYLITHVSIPGDYYATPKRAAMIETVNCFNPNEIKQFRLMR